MTRIETALQRMRDEAQVMVWHGDLAKALATPTGQALGALVEAAEAWRGEPSEYRTGQELDEPELCAAVDAFLAATEPAGGG